MSAGDNRFVWSKWLNDGLLEKKGEIQRETPG
jgi:hypothetical protein